MVDSEVASGQISLTNVEGRNRRCGRRRIPLPLSSLPHLVPPASLKVRRGVDAAPPDAAPPLSCHRAHCRRVLPGPVVLPRTRSAHRGVTHDVPAETELAALAVAWDRLTALNALLDGEDGAVARVSSGTTSPRVLEALLKAHAAASADIRQAIDRLDLQVPQTVAVAR
jgi:hypothetical protein